MKKKTKLGIKLVDIIIKNMSNDLDGMRIDNSDFSHSIENSIARIFLNESLGIVNIVVKDSEALEIEEEDLIEEYVEQVTTRKWWWNKPTTKEEKFTRPVLNIEDVKEIITKLTEVYNEYEHNRLTSITKKFNISLDDINYLKEYFRR